MICFATWALLKEEIIGVHYGMFISNPNMKALNIWDGNDKMVMVAAHKWFDASAIWPTD